MKILICTDSFLPGVGGTEQAVCAYANALVDDGNEVVLACPSYGKLQRDDSKNKFVTLRLPSLKLTSNDYAVLATLEYGKLKHMLGDFKPDVIHTETASGMTKLGLKLGKKFDVPVVMTIHTKFKEAFARMTGNFIASIMVKSLVRKLNRADKVISVMGNMIDELRTYGFKKDVTIIHNGAILKKSAISLEEKKKLRKKFGFQENDKIILFVGYMIAYKRVDFVIRAFAKAVNKGLDCKLLLVGGGIDLENFQKLAKQLGVEDRVTFTGVIRDREKVVEYYHLSDLFVTASIFDTDPVIICEAACNKLPALAIENTGCSGRLTDGFNGFTAKNDEEDFSDKIVEIFSKDFSDVAQNAFDTVPTTWAQNVSEHMPIYEALIKEKNEKVAKKAQKRVKAIKSRKTKTV